MGVEMTTVADERMRIAAMLFQAPIRPWAPPAASVTVFSERYSAGAATMVRGGRHRLAIRTPDHRGFAIRFLTSGSKGPSTVFLWQSVLHRVAR